MANYFPAIAVVSVVIVGGVENVFVPEIVVLPVFRFSTVSDKAYKSIPLVKLYASSMFDLAFAAILDARS